MGDDLDDAWLAPGGGKRRKQDAATVVDKPQHQQLQPPTARQQSKRKMADRDSDESSGKLLDESGDALDDVQVVAGDDADGADGDGTKRKRKKKKAVRRTPEIDSALGKEPAAQAEYVQYWYAAAAKTWRSELELADRRLTDEHFVNTSGFTGPHDDAHYASFIKAALPQWKHKLSDKTKGAASKRSFGTPAVLIVTSSGIRATEVIRSLPEFHQLCRIPKLFAKHFKVEEQVAYLKSHMVRIAVGTPNRLSKLVEANALLLDELTLVLVDCRKDVKQRSLFDVPEVNTDFSHFVEDHCWPLLKTGQLQLALF